MKVGLVILPVPGRSHLISTVESAKQINQRNHFSNTILTMAPPVPGILTLPTTFYESVASSGLDINFLGLAPVDPPKEPSVEAFILLYIVGHATHVKDSVLRLQSSIRVVAFVVDRFATIMAVVGDELGIPTYLFFTSGPALLSLILYLPSLDHFATIMAAVGDELGIPTYLFFTSGRALLSLILYLPPWIRKFESEFENLEESVDVTVLGSLTPLVMMTSERAGNLPKSENDERDGVRPILTRRKLPPKLPRTQR